MISKTGEEEPILVPLTSFHWALIESKSMGKFKAKTASRGQAMLCRRPSGPDEKFQGIFGALGLGSGKFKF
jgi:hypothetical protein